MKQALVCQDIDITNISKYPRLVLLEVLGKCWLCLFKLKNILEIFL